VNKTEWWTAKRSAFFLQKSCLKEDFDLRSEWIIRFKDGFKGLNMQESSYCGWGGDFCFGCPKNCPFVPISNRNTATTNNSTI
jgi:hypothetical protein